MMMFNLRVLLIKGAALCFAFTLFLGEAKADLFLDATHDYLNGKLDVAKEKLVKVLEADDGHMQARHYLATLLFQQKNYSESIRHLELLVDSSNPPEGSEDLLVNAYTASGNSDKALQLLKKMRQKNPSDEKVSFQYASALQAAGRGGEATVIFRSLAGSKGEYADQAHFQLGLIDLDYGAYFSAVRELKAIDPSSEQGPNAKAYIDALKPATRPVSVYALVEPFINTNPGSGSASTLGSAGSFTGSARGTTAILNVTSRQFEISQRLHTKLGYMFYGSFYGRAGAVQYDFMGHFINPSIIYKTSKSSTLELKGDIQFFDYGHQRLGGNIGATLSETFQLDGGHSTKVYASILNKKYTSSFVSGGATSSLKYLNANSVGLGVSGTLAAKEFIKDWNGSLTADFTFTNEIMANTSSTDATLAAQARDSKYKEYALKFNATLPLTKGESAFSLLANANYSYKAYPNMQSGTAYASISNRLLRTHTLISGVKLQTQLSKKYGVSLSVGAERTISRSYATELTYQSNKFSTALSAVF